MTLQLDSSSIQVAAKLIAPMVRRTTVLVSLKLNEALGANVWLKCEHLQHTGAFKYRGACHALLQLSEAERAQGVYTVSSGNHGTALAAAGQKLGIKVRVGVAANASEVKRANMAKYDAELVTIEPGMAAREAFVAAQRPTGRIFIPPYNHAHIWQGQGTATYELLQEQPELDCVIAPLGGGGLLSGTSVAAKAHGVPQVFGVEPELAADGEASFRTGVLQPAMPPLSVCDGLLTSVGDQTFPIIRQNVDDILLVSDSEALAAQKLVFELTDQWIEPSSATVIAAIQRYSKLFKGKRIGVIISGGNIAPPTFIS
ncbi:serine/threonine dehydratase [Pseudidiomarina tainanensis]|uniref:Serine/threonine dehydratase n=1 Tax=Pseudidiomarina tainanensis TaxID=502365 RepID=A0ACD2HHA8_9GAMM|nr:threonine/serine dehydratase [Pseudidiomarina tainanensis]RZQ55981.1 serine/threonine dehydratase [Pseudidiomarina tainanensis]